MMLEGKQNLPINPSKFLRFANRWLVLIVGYSSFRLALAPTSRLSRATGTKRTANHCFQPRG
jgi:hypothetical protein